MDNIANRLIATSVSLSGVVTGIAGDALNDSLRSAVHARRMMSGIRGLHR